MRFHPFARLVSLFFVCFTFISVRAAESSPLTFDAGGVISGTGGRVSIGDGGEVTIATSGGDTFNLTLAMVVRGGRFWNGNYLSDKKLVVDAAAKETVFTGDIVQPSLPAPIPVRYSIGLTPEGKARVTVRFDSKEPISNALSLASIFFETSRASAVGSQIRVNGTDVPVMAGTPSDQGAPICDVKDPRDIVFFSDDPYRTVSAHVVQASSVVTTDENLISRAATIGMRTFPLDNEIVIDVDLPEKARPLSAETYAGIDFYASEHIHLPQYGLSRNLIQNPGFEQGFQYWNFSNLGGDKGNRDPDNYVIDTTQAYAGHKCLKILGEKEERPSSLSSFPIPVWTGKDYTLSFYAKSDQPNVPVTTCVFPSAWAKGPAYHTTQVGTDWKRYSYTFNATGGALSIQFGVSGPGSDCAAYIDDVQLEQGPLTDFTEAPVGMAFVTDHRDNLFSPGDPIHGRWEIGGTPGAAGEIGITVRDYMGSILEQHSAPFKLSPGGTASVPEPWIEHVGRGLYIQEAIVKLADGFRKREFGRLAIMPPADPSVKHHTLFANGGIVAQYGSWDRVQSHLAYFGIGSAMNFDPPVHAELAMMAKHHITDVTSIFDSGDHFGKISLKKGWTGTDDELPVIEEDAYEKAKAYPEITYWKLVNEPDGLLTADPVAMKHWIRALTAAYRGIKRANPKALVISIDPANMEPNGGTAMVDNFLSCGGAAICDIAAIHPYRPRPEEPDMDSDLATFIAMLDRHGFKGQIWFTEGGGWLDVNNAAYGVDVHKALSDEDNGGSWRIGNFSYDIGDGERYAAAYNMRAWLIGLKYGDRVKQQVQWSYGTGTFDYDCTPDARALATNTLSAVLGNADYVRDIPLSQDVRCYLFKDSANRPVAVLWTHDLRHEIATLPPSMLHLGAYAKRLRMIDMVGGPAAVNKSGDMALSPFPVFLRGESGSTDKLISAIEGGFVSSSTGSVIGYAQVKDGGHVGIELRNTLMKAVDGKLSVTSPSATPVSASLKVAPGKTGEVSAPFSTPADGIHAEDVTIQWTGTGSAKPQVFPAHIESFSCPRVSAPLPLDSSLSAWKAAGADVFAIPQHMISFKPYPANPKYADGIPWGGPSDLSASMAIAYMPGTLYLGFDVMDNVLAPGPSADKAWMGDGMQLYFDPWDTGHSLSKIGFDDDDQELDVWPSGDTPTIYRAIAPAFQVAFLKRGVVSGIQFSLTKRAGGYIVELAIPEAELAPLSLKAGGVFNFSLIINDSDGEYRKRGLTLTPNGTEPFQHPELFPSVVLGK